MTDQERSQIRSYQLDGLTPKQISELTGISQNTVKVHCYRFAFVQDLLGMTGQQFVHEYMVECEGDYERLWERHYSQLKHIDASRFRIWAFHITGSLDHCRSIKQEGLRNLHYALSTNSAMSRMFRKYGLLIDVVQKTTEFEQAIFQRHQLPRLR